jgi:hypothetical protein
MNWIENNYILRMRRSGLEARPPSMRWGYLWLVGLVIHINMCSIRGGVGGGEGHSAVKKPIDNYILFSTKLVLLTLNYIQCFCLHCRNEFEIG